ncbi:zinc-ribbon domain-containing protein [Paenibacillus naphthalenovorans]|uniref:zinc-ribbon domain-containing protein n=1 Tax=Paenibacillus naphthalenovorans TaxID=162209 RepID=UPI003D2966EB
MSAVPVQQLKQKREGMWVCTEKGHSYAASPDNRVGKGSGCKRCASSRRRRKKRSYLR